ncbi:polysaccharide deacetylase family protein [Paenibacillus sp. HN-1]|nr:polysaccharide deacetylase family protein [Paenibacillus sp. CGMCC 1.18879]MBY9077931.1 polysaccharide deacetylase family protein [Paenibacillus sp. CGMCC 1.18879]MBY9084633.1 polysaccharide deacetylase family protein [Paenibacillus sinensis]
MPAANEAGSNRIGRMSARSVRKAVRYLMIAGLLALLCIRIKSGWLTESADALNRDLSEVKAPATIETAKVDLPQSIVRLPVGKEPTPVVRNVYEAHTETAPQPTTEHKDYEIVEVGAEQPYFGLPKGYVALTFDDGPSPYTKKIVDILINRNVAATFLFIGQNVEHNRGAVAYASEHGMAIGNHSWDHSSKLTKVSLAAQTTNLAKTSKLLESVTHTPVTLFRPPYGLINKSLISSAKGQQMKVLMWNRDPEDWNADKKEDILKYFHKVTASGGVYVLHEDRLTVEALPEIIGYLKEKNMKFAIFK